MIDRNFENHNVIRALIFDIGNVVLFFDNRKVSRNLHALTHLPEDYIFKTVFDLYLQLEIDLGKTAMDTYLTLIRKKLDLAIPIEQVRHIFNDIFTENQVMSSFIRWIKMRLPLVAVTNTNRSHFEYILKKFDVLHCFNRIFASCDLGIKKPHPGIYHRVVSYLGLNPSECLFIDDQTRNLITASMMGFHVHQYHGYETFRSHCRLIGL